MKKYGIIKVSEFRSHLHKILFSVSFYHLVELRAQNHFKTAQESEYIKERERLVKELAFYENQAVPVESFWYESTENLIDTLKEDIVLLDYKKELGLIK